MARRLPGYKPMNPLGSGPTGVVVSAQDTTTGATVAIKYLSSNVFRSLDFVDRYRDEVAALVEIENPHVAQVYEFIEGPRSAAIVTELVTGVSLRTILAKGGALAPESALYVLKGALRGLAEGHRRGVVHRDVKPANLLVDAAGLVKVIDFGIAVPTRRDTPAPGDPRYLAPELWEGRLPTSTSDVHAASAMLFECLTGRPPRSAGGGYVGQAALASDEVISAIRALNVPNEVRTLLARGLAYQPGGRAVDADAMLDDLELAALGGYGSDWEDTGKALLVSRVGPLLGAPVAEPSRARRAIVVATRLAGAAGTTRILVAAGLIVVLAIGVLTVSSGVFVPASAAPTGQANGPSPVPTIAHTPVPIPAPTVPAPSAKGPHPDKIKPGRPTGLRVTGRSQTAISLDWNPALDNVKVIGYIIQRGGRRVGTSYNPGFTDTGLAAKTTYEYSVIAFDAAGNLSPSSAVVAATTLVKPDTSPPSVPTGLHSTGQSTTTIVLAWQSSHDDVGVAGYDVFRDTVRIASTTHPNFTDTGLTPATAYKYSVRAFDTANNASTNSTTITVSTLVAPDKTAPTVPTGLNATAASDTEIDLQWSSSTDNVGVTGYFIYRNGTNVGTTAGTTYTDTGLLASTSYSYTVSAFDAASNESARSSPPQSATTFDPPPPPPPPPTPTPTPPAPPVVNSITINTSPITSPDCTTTVTATVVVTGGPITVELDYTIDGAGGVPQFVSFDVNGGTQTVVLGTGDGTTDGSASVDDPISGLGESTNWTAPSDCIPPPPPQTPDPTDT